MNDVLALNKMEGHLKTHHWLRTRETDACGPSAGCPDLPSRNPRETCLISLSWGGLRELVQENLTFSEKTMIPCRFSVQPTHGITRLCHRSLVAVLEGLQECHPDAAPSPGLQRLTHCFSAAAKRQA